MNLQDVCIRASRRYYQFLEENKLGLLEIAVVEKQLLDDDLWKVMLARRIFDLDTIQLKVRGQIYLPGLGGHFTVDSYDEETRVLVVKLRREIPGFEEARANEVRIVCNLRFLVTRVQDWFIANGHECCLPSGREEKPLTPLLDLNPAQMQAYEAAHVGPAIYVWGPPGTGKTRYVLTSAVINLVGRGKRVAIVAPTNLSLELAVSAVLEACDQLRTNGRFDATQLINLDRQQFLRLGFPTRKFVERFRDVCEERGVQHQVAQHRRRLVELQKVIRFKKNRACVPVIDRVLEKLRELEDLLADRGDKLQRQAGLQRRGRLLRSSTGSTIPRLANWLSGSLQKKEREIEAINSEVALLESELGQVEEKCTGLLNEISREWTGSRMLDDLLGTIGSVDVTNAASGQQLTDYHQRLADIRENTCGFVSVEQALAEPYTNLTVEQVEAEVEALRIKIEELQTRTTEERLRQARVIACTLDTFITRFRDSAAPVDHIFLDEAGYAPAIKALALFRRNIPVTLLGDHKQLPPVCEMDDEDMSQENNHACVLWSRSALFAKYLLQAAPPDESTILTCLRENIEESPLEHRFPRSVLKLTHRFGNNLARLLDELFYERIGFESACVDGVDLIVRFVSVRSSGDGRMNSGEAVAAAQWIQQHGALGIAVIAPYKAQVAELSRVLPSGLRDEVLTIHASQGREWDTVVLSAADTSRRPYFTDTTLPIGKLVMNTAISRAKKRIVLVFDADYWSGRQDRSQQLLARLCNT